MLVQMRIDSQRSCGFGLIRQLLLCAVMGWAAGVSAEAVEKTERWSFQPIGSVVPPIQKNNRWIKNPIDAFVLSNLQQKNLSPAPPSSRLTFLRRASFDLIGLPPTLEEIESYVKDERPEAEKELVDRLLGSPHYGERWGRHWLDLARYADTGGFEKDLSYPNAWQFRDYVIRSFNANKPFNRFIQEQVAGDELWPGDPEAVVATSLFAIGPVSQDSALMSTQLEYEWLTDATDTTGAAFLGLTLGCARCHDHKYDPITQQDTSLCRRFLRQAIGYTPTPSVSIASRVSMEFWPMCPFRGNLKMIRAAPSRPRTKSARNFFIAKPRWRFTG